MPCRQASEKGESEAAARLPRLRAGDPLRPMSDITVNDRAGGLSTMTERERGEPQAEALADQAAHNTLALNPLVGMRGNDLMDSAAIMLKAMITEPMVAANESLTFLGE